MPGLWAGHIQERHIGFEGKPAKGASANARVASGQQVERRGNRLQAEASLSQ